MASILSFKDVNDPHLPLNSPFIIWGHMIEWDTDASRVSSHASAGSGARNLLSPTGGVEKGISAIHFLLLIAKNLRKMHLFTIKGFVSVWIICCFDCATDRSLVRRIAVCFATPLSFIFPCSRDWKGKINCETYNPHLFKFLGENELYCALNLIALEAYHSNQTRQ